MCRIGLELGMLRDLSLRGRGFRLRRGFWWAGYFLRMVVRLGC
jgi:hypothetical protein